MNNKVNGKTGEDFLNSIANSLANFPNISYLASVLSDIKDKAVVMTSATRTTAGKSGFVPTPPAFSSTNDGYALLGSDAQWHNNINAQLTQNLFNRDQSSTTDTKIFLLGSNNNSITTTANIATVHSGNEFYISSYLATTSTSGILKQLNDPDLGLYFDHMLMEDAYGQIWEMTPIANTPHNIDRLVIADRNQTRASTEFLLGKYICMTSNTTNGGTEPRSALVLGNISFNDSSVYKPYVLKVSGNNMSLYHVGETHFIKSSYDTTNNKSKWIFKSPSRFRFENHTEIIPAAYGNSLTNITDANFDSDLANYCKHYVNNVLAGYKGAFISGNEIKFISSTGSGPMRKMYEGGLYSLQNGGMMFRGMTRTILANYIAEGWNYQNTKLRSTLELGDKCYVSTDVSVNGGLTLFLKRTSDSDGIGLFNGGFGDNVYSTRYNYNDMQALSTPIDIEFKGPSDSASYPGLDSTTTQNIKNGNAFMKISVDNVYSLAGSWHQSFDIVSILGSNYSTNELRLLSIQRQYSNTVNVVMYLNSDISINDHRIYGVSKLDATNIKATEKVTAAEAVVTTTKTNTIQGTDSISKIGTQSVPITSDYTLENNTAKTVVNIASGTLVASGKGVGGASSHTGLKELPVNEVSDTDAYYYRPIIVTQSNYEYSTIPDHIKNAPNGYIWICTG